MRSRDREIKEALKALTDAARDRVDAHPYGHLLRGREPLSLTVSLPLDQDPDALEAAGERAVDALHDGVEALLAHAAAFRPGRLLCLRCGTPECEHAAAPHARQVFVGYGPSGLPRFVDFATLVVDRRHEQMERLFDGAAPLLSLVMSEPELVADLLPAFHDKQRQYRVHAQVVAGFWRLPDESGRPEPLAVTIQIVSTHVMVRQQQPRRRFGVNIIGRGPDNEPLDHLHDRLRGIPWISPVRWVQSALGEIEKQDAKRRIAEGSLAKRLDGLVQSLARRLGRDERAKGRRTMHAEERHESGDRPTRVALADLAAASDDKIVFDTRRNTLVVLGEKGRAHVFNVDGKLVTSVRYPTTTIAHRRESGLWRRAEAAEIAPLRALLG
ncbi:MAG: hypothetical protein U0V87_09650 [Acidobacteriota bacterium]